MSPHRTNSQICWNLFCKSVQNVTWHHCPTSCGIDHLQIDTPAKRSFWQNVVCSRMINRQSKATLQPFQPRMTVSARTTSKKLIRVTQCGVKKQGTTLDRRLSLDRLCLFCCHHNVTVKISNEKAMQDFFWFGDTEPDIMQNNWELLLQTLRLCGKHVPILTTGVSPTSCPPPR